MLDSRSGQERVRLRRVVLLSGDTGLLTETAACDGLNGLAPGQIDSRAMTEAVADSDSFVSPDTAAATRPRVLFFAWLVGRGRRRPG